MKPDPTLYAVLMDRAVKPPVASVREALDRRLSHLSNVLTDEIVDTLRHAYAAGVRDGFAQGVAAAEEAAAPMEGRHDA